MKRTPHMPGHKRPRNPELSQALAAEPLLKDDEPLEASEKIVQYSPDICIENLLAHIERIDSSNSSTPRQMILDTRSANLHDLTSVPLFRTLSLWQTCLGTCSESPPGGNLMAPGLGSSST